MLSFLPFNVSFMCQVVVRQMHYNYRDRRLTVKSKKHQIQYGNRNKMRWFQWNCTANYGNWMHVCRVRPLPRCHMYITVFRSKWEIDHNCEFRVIRLLFSFIDFRFRIVQIDRKRCVFIVCSFVCPKHARNKKHKKCSLFLLFDANKNGPFIVDVGQLSDPDSSCWQ